VLQSDLIVRVPDIVRTWNLVTIRQYLCIANLSLMQHG